jgi:hypothetical protein
MFLLMMITTSATNRNSLKKEALITDEANCGSPQRPRKSCIHEEMGVSQVTEAKMAFTYKYRV